MGIARDLFCSHALGLGGLLQCGDPLVEIGHDLTHGLVECGSELGAHLAAAGLGVPEPGLQDRHRDLQRPELIDAIKVKAAASLPDADISKLTVSLPDALAEPPCDEDSGDNRDQHGGQPDGGRGLQLPAIIGVLALDQSGADGLLQFDEFGADRRDVIDLGLVFRRKQRGEGRILLGFRCSHGRIKHGILE